LDSSRQGFVSNLSDLERNVNRSQAVDHLERL
jgi:hypothetical protein